MSVCPVSTVPSHGIPSKGFALLSPLHLLTVPDPPPVAMSNVLHLIFLERNEDKSFYDCHSFPVLSDPLNRGTSWDME